MKKLFFIVIIAAISVCIISCSKEENMIASKDKKITSKYEAIKVAPEKLNLNHNTGTDELPLINIRDSSIGDFTLQDMFINTSVMVCSKIDTTGKTIVNVNNSCLTVAEWEEGIDCAGYIPTKVEAAVFPPYSLLLINNGMQTHNHVVKLFVCKNEQFYFGIDINTLIVKRVTFSDNTNELKLTCNDSGIHSPDHPDYCIVINL